jgi:hypothetical protein
MKAKAVFHEEADGVDGIERVQHLRVVDDLTQAEPCENEEPDDHDRRERLADDLGAVTLDGEKATRMTRQIGNT